MKLRVGGVLLENGHSEASRLAVFLGLPKGKGMSDLTLVERVERGFPPNTANIIVKRVDPKGEFLQVHHIIPKSTYHRRLKKMQALQIIGKILERCMPICTLCFLAAWKEE